MIQQGMHGFVGNRELYSNELDKELNTPTDKRVFYLSQAFEQGYTVDRIHNLTKIDRWFLYKLKNIIDTAHLIEKISDKEHLPTELFITAKKTGFSDYQIEKLIYKKPMPKDTIRNERIKRGILPVVKQIDTLAAEYPAQTNYLYLTYNVTANDVQYLGDHRSVIVLGS